jgi:hypothetical protein
MHAFLHEGRAQPLTSLGSRGATNQSSNCGDVYCSSEALFNVPPGLRNLFVIGDGQGYRFHCSSWRRQSLRKDVN